MSTTSKLQSSPGPHGLLNVPYVVIQLMQDAGIKLALITSAVESVRQVGERLQPGSPFRTHRL